MPDLPGLGVAAETRAETEALFREGIEFLLAGLREDGLPIPEPHTQVIEIAVPHRVYFKQSKFLFFLKEGCNGLACRH